MSDRLDVTRQGRPVCERPAAGLGETIDVAVLQERWSVDVDQALGPSTVATHNWVGRLTPAYRLDEARRAELVEPLVAGAAEISHRMGWYVTGR